jgi:hypothetical protein
MYIMGQLQKPKQKEEISNGSSRKPGERKKEGGVDPGQYSPPPSLPEVPEWEAEIRAPYPNELIRVYPGDEFQRRMLAISFKGIYTTEIYLLDKDLVEEQGVPSLYTLSSPIVYTVLNNYGDVYLWPVFQLVNKNHRISSWTQTALRVVEKAQKTWVCVIPSRATRGYVIRVPLLSDMPAGPLWPDVSFDDVLRACRGRFISAYEHPVMEYFRHFDREYLLTLYTEAESMVRKMHAEEIAWPSAITSGAIEDVLHFHPKFSEEI